MNCDTAREEFSALLDGELTPDVQAAVEEHLAECSECLRRLEGYRRVSSLYTGLERVDAPGDFEEEIRRKLVPASSRATLRVSRRSVWPYIAAAAACILMFGGAWQLLRSGTNQFEMASAPQATTATDEAAIGTVPAEEGIEVLQSMGYLDNESEPIELKQEVDVLDNDGDGVSANRAFGGTEIPGVAGGFGGGGGNSGGANFGGGKFERGQTSGDVERNVGLGVAADGMTQHRVRMSEGAPHTESLIENSSSWRSSEQPPAAKTEPVAPHDQGISTDATIRLQDERRDATDAKEKTTTSTTEALEDAQAAQAGPPLAKNERGEVENGAREDYSLARRISAAAPPAAAAPIPRAAEHMVDSIPPAQPAESAPIPAAPAPAPARSLPAPEVAAAPPVQPPADDSGRQVHSLDASAPEELPRLEPRGSGEMAVVTAARTLRYRDGVWTQSEYSEETLTTLQRGTDAWNRLKQRDPSLVDFEALEAPVIFRAFETWYRLQAPKQAD